MRIVPFIAIFLRGSIATVIVQEIAQAQAPAQFEVAAIKPSSGPQRGRAEIATPLGCRGGPGTSDPGRLSCRESLATLVTRAYQLKSSYQFTPPDWMETTTSCWIS